MVVHRSMTVHWWLPCVNTKHGQDRNGDPGEMWLIIGTYLLLMKPGSSGFPENFKVFHRHRDDTGNIHKLPFWWINDILLVKLYCKYWFIMNKFHTHLWWALHHWRAGVGETFVILKHKTGAAVASKRLTNGVVISTQWKWSVTIRNTFGGLCSIQWHPFDCECCPVRKVHTKSTNNFKEFIFDLEFMILNSALELT